jgi:hypothetical protein
VPGEACAGENPHLCCGAQAGLRVRRGGTECRQSGDLSPVPGPRHMGRSNSSVLPNITHGWPQQVASSFSHSQGKCGNVPLSGPVSILSSLSVLVALFLSLSLSGFCLYLSFSWAMSLDLSLGLSFPRLSGFLSFSEPFPFPLVFASIAFLLWGRLRSGRGKPVLCGLHVKAELQVSSQGHHRDSTR